MSSYVIGDIQGCYNALCRVLEKANFDPAKDTIWLVGDLVNRGGQSLQTIKLLYTIKKNIHAVLGNHDLYLLKCRYCESTAPIEKELQKIIRHEKADRWFHWLQSLPLYHFDSSRNMLMVHAGLPHIWSLQKAISLAKEAQKAIATRCDSFFWDNFFGNHPRRWDEDLCGVDRVRCIVNYFTRMRYIDSSGKLYHEYTGKPNKKLLQDKKYLPWYAFHRTTDVDMHILFGHWAALKGKLYGYKAIHATATDTGCVWNGELTMQNIDTKKIYTAKQYT